MSTSAPFAFENGLTVCRTKNTIISDIDNGDVSRFKRNMEYRGTGYSSPSNQPYHTFGSLLEVDRLSRYVVPKTRPTSQGKHEAGWTTPLPMNNGLTPRPIKVQRMSTFKCTPPPSINAGLSSINVGVCASDWGKREVRAGSCLVEMIARQKERKNFLHGCQKAMLYKKRKQFNKSHTPSVYLNGLSVQNSYKGSLVARNINAALFNESQLKVPVPPVGLESPGRDVEKDATQSAEERRKSVFPNLKAALVAANFKHRTVKQDLETKLRAELLECQRNYLASIEIIYYILCVLHNMKSKDLKSKAPLSKQALKKLSQKPRYYAGGLTSEPLDVAQQHRLSNWSKSSSASKMMRGAMTTPVTTPLYLFRESNIGTGSMAQAGRESHLKDPWPRPPWQRPIIFMNGSEEEKDPKVKIDACCQQFRQAKDELSYKLFKKLLDCDKNHDSRMIDKLELLTFGFTYIDELIELRDNTLKRNKTNKTPSMGKLRKPEWFLLLEQKTNSLLDHPLLIKKGTAAMNKLELFIALDIAENSNIVERLCLLTFSIPIYKVCTPSYVRAIKFVLQHVLQVKPDLLNQWMEIRKLPIIDTD